MTGTRAGDVPEQPMSASRSSEDTLRCVSGAEVERGECEEAEGAHATDSDKPVTGTRAGDVPEQPMSAATLRLFAHATDLEGRMRAVLAAAEAQAAVHGTLQADLEAARARVAAVPVPPKTPGGASARCAVRLKRRPDRNLRRPKSLLARGVVRRAGRFTKNSWRRPIDSPVNLRPQRQPRGRLLGTTRLRRFALSRRWRLEEYPSTRRSTSHPCRRRERPAWAPLELFFRFRVGGRTSRFQCRSL